MIFWKRDGKHVLKKTVHLCTEAVREHGQNITTDSDEEKQKLYLFAGLAYLIDLGSSLSNERLAVPASLTMRSLFETVVKGVNLIHDPDFLERFEYSWLKEQVGMNTYMVDNPERYGELLDRSEGRYYLSLKEIYEQKKSSKKIKPLQMNELTDSATSYLKAADSSSAGFTHYYNEIYKFISNYFAHFSPGVVSAYMDAESEYITISQYLAPIDPVFHKIAAGLIGMYLDQLNSKYELNITMKLEKLSDLLGKVPD